MSEPASRPRPSILHRAWFPWLTVLLIAGGLFALCGLGSLAWLGTALYPGAAWVGTQGMTVTAQGGREAGMITLAARNVFSAQADSVSEISAWYRARGWQPRFRANTSEGTAYVNTHTLRFATIKIEWQTRVTALYDLSPPRLLVHTTLAISW